MLHEAPGLSPVASLDRGQGAEGVAVVASGLRAALRRLSSGPVAVWAASEELAVLAETILREAGLDRNRVTLVSVGGDAAAYERLRDPEGLLAATLAWPYEVLGETAVDVLDDLLAGTPPETINPGGSILLDAVLVDRATAPTDDVQPPE
jgi:simple sugar transport system substrate-binding protein/ribose transport system substrate-binding protein